MEILRVFSFIIFVNSAILKKTDGERNIISQSDSIHKEEDKEPNSLREEDMLHQKLLLSYKKHLRPVLDSGQAVHVNVSLVLENVVDINEKHQSLTTLLWMLAEWYDPYLSWNDTEFPSVTYFVVGIDQIWSPDLMIYNVLGNTIKVAGEFLGKPESVSVLSSGKVHHWSPVLLNLFCPMKMDLFPFDLQSCPVILSPWIYDNSQLKLHPAQHAARFGKLLDMSKKWIIQDFRAEKSVLHDAEHDRSYDQMHFSISLKRKSTFYVLNLLLPCYLISIIACLCYVIPPQGGDRINLLLTTFLSIVVFVLVVLEIVPEESDTLPLFSKFLLKVMLMNMFQILYCTVVCGLNDMDTIRIGPPKCLVTSAKCITSCLLSSCCSRSTTAVSQHEDMNTAATNSPGKPKAETEIEFTLLHENNEEDLPGKIASPEENQSVLLEQNIKDWRIIFKAVDFMLFMLSFLGLTGYFLGVLLVYY